MRFLFILFPLVLMASGCASFAADSHTVVSQYNQGRYERVEKTCHTLNHEVWRGYHCHVETFVQEARK